LEKKKQKNFDPLGLGGGDVFDPDQKEPCLGFPMIDDCYDGVGITRRGLGVTFSL